MLDAVPPETKKLLLRELESVPLPVGTALFEADTRPRYVHFITSGVASTLTDLSDGGAVEVGLTGSEGLPEKIHLLGPQTGMTRCFMQVAGAGMRMEFRRFERIFHEDESLHAAVLRCVQSEALTLAQLCACNRMHEVEERLARWLLMVQDRTGDVELRLTQEFLAQMLGARRSTVNLAAGTLQRSGLIEFRRSHIRVQDRELLEDVACECYRLMKKLLDTTYDDMPANGR